MSEQTFNNPVTVIVDRVEDFVKQNWLDGSWGQWQSPQFTGNCLLGSAYRAATELLAEQGFNQPEAANHDWLMAHPPLQEAVDAMKEAILMLMPQWAVDHGYAAWSRGSRSKAHWDFGGKDRLTIPSFNDSGDVGQKEVLNVVQYARVLLESREWDAKYREDTSLITKIRGTKKKDSALTADDYKEIEQMLRDADKLLDQRARTSDGQRREMLGQEAEEKRREARTRYAKTLA